MTGLFPDAAAPARPRQSRRVMMHFTDAGPGLPNWARFRCKKCGAEHETHSATDAELRRGKPCPNCNKAKQPADSPQ